MKEFKFKDRVSVSEVQKLAKDIEKEKGDIYMDFSRCKVGLQILNKVIKVIKILNNHVALDLSYTQIGSSSLSQLKDMLKTFQGSLSLDVSGNKIGTESLCELIKELLKSNRLVELRFHEFDIKPSVYDAIIKVIRSSKVDLDLAFDYYKLSREQAEGIDQAVRDAEIEVKLKFSKGLNVVELSAERSCVDSVVLQPSLVKIPFLLYESKDQNAKDNLVLMLQSSRFPVDVEVGVPGKHCQALKEEILRYIRALVPVVRGKKEWEHSKSYGSSYFSKDYIEEQWVLLNKMFHEYISVLRQKNQVLQNAPLGKFLIDITKLISPRAMLSAINRFADDFSKNISVLTKCHVALHMSEYELEEFKFIHQTLHGGSRLELALLINKLKECIRLESCMKQEKWDAVKFIISPFEENPIYLEAESCEVEGSKIYEEVAYYFCLSCDQCIFPSEILEKMFCDLSFSKMLAILENSSSALKEKYSKLLQEGDSSSNNSTGIVEEDPEEENREAEEDDTPPEEPGDADQSAGDSLSLGNGNITDNFLSTSSFAAKDMQMRDLLVTEETNGPSEGEQERLNYIAEIEQLPSQKASADLSGDFPTPFLISA